MNTHRRIAFLLFCGVLFVAWLFAAYLLSSWCLLASVVLGLSSVVCWESVEFRLLTPWLAFASFSLTGIALILLDVNFWIAGGACVAMLLLGVYMGYWYDQFVVGRSIPVSADN